MKIIYKLIIIKIKFRSKKINREKKKLLPSEKVKKNIFTQLYEDSQKIKEKNDKKSKF